MRTRDWSVDVGLEAPGDERVAFDDLLGILEALRDWGVGGLETDTEDEVGRYDVRFCVEALDAQEAIGRGTEIIREAVKRLGLPQWPTVRLEALTIEELERENASAVWPELVGVAELAEVLDVSKQRASELARSASFPAPFTTLASGPIWVRAAIDIFVERWDRKPGRPSKADLEVRDEQGRVMVADLKTHAKGLVEGISSRVPKKGSSGSRDPKAPKKKGSGRSSSKR